MKFPLFTRLFHMTEIGQGARKSMNDSRTCTQSGAKLAHYVPLLFTAFFSRRFSSRSTASRMKAAEPSTHLEVQLLGAISETRAHLVMRNSEVSILADALKDARAFMQQVMEERGDHGVSILIRAADEALACVPLALRRGQ
jgi:hypothetical protein